MLNNFHAVLYYLQQIATYSAHNFIFVQTFSRLQELLDMDGSEPREFSFNTNDNPVSHVNRLAVSLLCVYVYVYVCVCVFVCVCVCVHERERERERERDEGRGGGGGREH